jgi:hypothetical protein
LLAGSIASENVTRGQGLLFLRAGMSAASEKSPTAAR